MPAPNKQVIGVLGGMGPHAGVDLVDKIIAQTDAATDQEHVPVALLSYPERLVDRSTFLFGEIDTNPAYALADVLRLLDDAGAVVAGMPCNTAHAPSIFDTIVQETRRTGHQVELLHMIEETVEFMQATMPHIETVGTLSTQAVYELNLHRTPLEAAGFSVVTPDPVMRELVNTTIFDTSFGLKAQSHPATPQAKQNLLDTIQHLIDRGADAVVLGCTELPLAPLAADMDLVPLIDPAEVLARALIDAVHPDHLKPLPPRLATFQTA
ncbi:MAG: amino acid racemase [Longimonas sp.]|uniref:aspartate/glutamate racemase family protein n=1 Tax=Longimonas sp. TaxID=2039626 RepID=UPI0039750CD6